MRNDGSLVFESLQVEVNKDEVEAESFDSTQFDHSMDNGPSGTSAYDSQNNRVPLLTY